MNNKANTLALFALLMYSGASLTAEILITPMIGFTGGGAVEDEDGNTYDMENAASYALAVETPLEKGRVGFFYSNQQSELDSLKLDSSIQYLHFQSSIYYPATNQFSGYLGLGLGASYVDVDWAKDKYGFSASIFGGVEYKLSDSLAFTSQLRWLGTVVDNDTSGACTVPSTGQNCVIRFDTDWMNQFQANVGLTFTF